jgi:hypothetical protein
MIPAIANACAKKVLFHALGTITEYTDSTKDKKQGA